MNYYARMEFEWDPDKSDTCFTERGFDFAYVLRAFLDENRLIHKDARWDYGEERYRLLGLIEGRIFLQFTPCEGGRSESFLPAKPINVR